MPENNSDLFKVTDPEARAMIRQMADADLRSYGNEIAWLARQEWARRFSQPNADVSIADAEAAHLAASRSAGAIE